MSARDSRRIFAAALSRSDLVVLTGGLGPTDDDLTRDVVSASLGLEMREDPAIVAQIASRFARRGLRMPEVNRRQAMVPAGAVSLDNPNGTAPGLYIEHQGHVVVLLPGPPRELQPMFDGLCEGPLLARAGAERLFKEVLFVAGRGESHVEEIAQPHLFAVGRRIAADRDDDPGDARSGRTAPDASGPRSGSGRGARACGPRGTRSGARRRRLQHGRAIDGGSRRRHALRAGTDHLDRRVVYRRAIMSRLTDVPGSSRYVLGGAIAYSNEAKTELAQVSPELIAAHGAVSEAVAVALADGIRARTGASVSLGVTGIAGPGGGSPEKPVGTVAIALTGSGMPARVRLFSFFGGRPQVKFQASQAALDMVRRALIASRVIGF